MGGDETSLSDCQALIGKLPAHEQKLLLYSVIAILAKTKLASSSSDDEAKPMAMIKALGGVSSLIAALIAHRYDLQVGLTDWLIGVSASAVGQSHMIHRAVISVLSPYTSRQSQKPMIKTY